MEKIALNLWFDSQAEDAAKYYVSLFKDSKIVGVTRYGEAGAKASGRPVGSVLTVNFRLEGQDFVALNGGPVFKLSPAISLIVKCGSQAEVDRFWEKLSEGGKPGVCGWLEDRYGVSWQIVPTALAKMLLDKDPRKTEAVMTALIQMKKLDISALKKAYAGG
jgi:predicted 3-demethylubiquinone-9 3-methyltransferase (glyoxalase superfamily)